MHDCDLVEDMLVHLAYCLPHQRQDKPLCTMCQMTIDNGYLSCLDGKEGSCEESAPQNTLAKLYLRLRFVPSANKSKNVSSSIESEKDIRQKVEDYHHCSFDGSLIWTIEKCEEKLEQVAEGREVSIHSSAFFSSPAGYKLRGHLNIHGSGDTKGTHMSLLVTTESGRFDPILVWPFNYPIIVGIFDQTGQNKHIVDVISPSVTSDCGNSKVKIIGEIQRLCPLSAIQREDNPYIKNDKMFMKLMIDYLWTPRPVLPFAMDVNPGLPMAVQEFIRRKRLEMYRRARAGIVSVIKQNNDAMRARALI